MLRLRHLAPLALVASSAASLLGGVKVSVQFFGEAQCPFCRHWVEDVWPEIWDDEELKSYVDYDFVPWGNAYFGTQKCGFGPYDPKQRACFYENCIGAYFPDENECFGGQPVYQHSLKEGEVDIYETCILQDNGLEEAIEFTYCVEGSIMDDEDMSAKDLLGKCAPDGVDAALIYECKDQRGRELEIENAKKTPDHPGVPYVLVDGEMVEQPDDTKQVLCDKLKEKGVEPKACASDDYYIRGRRTLR